jgi:lipopolysaccharide export system permease protein
MQTQFFPSPTIAFYMAKMFLVRAFSVLAALVLVLQTLDMLGQSGKILAVPGNSSAELWIYVSLRLPQIIAFVLPFSVLLGTLITFVTLNQNSEVVSMKAAGLSAHQVLAPLMLTSLLVAGVSFAFNDRIVSRASATLDKWEKVEFAALPKDSNAQINVWVRDGDDLIHAAVVSGKGADARLEDVTVYDRSGGSLQGIIEAKSGKFAGRGWQITEARRFEVASGKVQQLGEIVVAPTVRPDQFTLASVDPEGLSFRKLWDAITNLKKAGRPTLELETELWHKISGPLSALLMPLLAAVAAFGVARSGRLFVRAVIGMALGFAYFVADNFGLAMGNLGAYPPFLAAWGPFFLFLLIGEAVLVQTEE